MTKRELKGKSGVKYGFGIFKLEEELPDQPGVYFLVKDGQPIQYGVTENLREEVLNLREKHDVEDCHIYFHLRYDEVFCSLIKQDLLKDSETQGINQSKKAQFVF